MEEFRISEATWCMVTADPCCHVTSDNMFRYLHLEVLPSSAFFLCRAAGYRGIPYRRRGHGDADSGGMVCRQASDEKTAKSIMNGLRSFDTLIQRK